MNNISAARATLPANVALAAQRINNELIRRPSKPMTFSHHARSKLEVLQTEYLADVAESAIRAARKDGLVTVDEAHVDSAAARIGSGAVGAGPVATAANTMGGLLAGAALASIYAIMFGQDAHSTAEIVTAITLSVLGFSLLAIGLTLTFIKHT